MAKSFSVQTEVRLKRFERSRKKFPRDEEVIQKKFWPAALARLHVPAHVYLRVHACLSVCVCVFVCVCVCVHV